MSALLGGCETGAVLAGVANGIETGAEFVVVVDVVVVDDDVVEVETEDLEDREGVVRERTWRKGTPFQ